MWVNQIGRRDIISRSQRTQTEPTPAIQIAKSGDSGDSAESV
jgi:hypothetical protein